MKKIGFIGCGNMGGAIIRGVITAKKLSPENIICFDLLEDHLNKLVEETNINKAKDNIELVKESDIVVLALKPYIYESAIDEFKSVLRDEHIIIGMTPDVKIAEIKKMAGKENLKVARIMPNTPAQVLNGVTGISFSKEIEEAEKLYLKDIFSAISEVFELKEDMIKAIGTLSGCTPAFAYMFIEALAQGGIHLGFQKDMAYKIAAQTLKGAAQMVLETNKAPSVLRDEVCSPKGTTIRGVKYLEASGFKGIVMNAMDETYLD